eukprot:390826-Prymnesium_polylepis.1
MTTDKHQSTTTRGITGVTDEHTVKRCRSGCVRMKRRRGRACPPAAPLPARGQGINELLAAVFRFAPAIP